MHILFNLFKWKTKNYEFLILSYLSPYHDSGIVPVEKTLKLSES